MTLSYDVKRMQGEGQNSWFESHQLKPDLFITFKTEKEREV